jgi:hypothetical protein
VRPHAHAKPEGERPADRRARPLARFALAFPLPPLQRSWSSSSRQVPRAPALAQACEAAWARLSQLKFWKCSWADERALRRNLEAVGHRNERQRSARHTPSDALVIGVDSARRDSFSHSRECWS